MGTTIRTAGSREVFRAIDYDANLAVARAAFDAGARRIGLVSAVGANARSSVFYTRVKGELEDAILKFDTEATVVVRPAVLMGDRKSLGQSARPGETLAKLIMNPLSMILPANYRPISALKVARALLVDVPASLGTRVISSAELQSY